MEIGKTQTLPYQKVQVAQLDSSSRYLYVGGGEPGQHGSLTVLSWPKMEIVQNMDLFEDVCMDLQVSPDGLWIAVASMDRNICILRTSDLKASQLETEHSKPITSIDWVSNSVLVSTGVDTSIRVRGTEDAKVRKTFLQHKQTVHDLATHRKSAYSDLELLASCSSDGTVRFWQPTQGRLLRFYSLENDKPRRIQWVGTSQILSVGTEKGNVEIVDSQSVKKLSVDHHFEDPVNALSVRESAAGTIQIMAGSESGEISLQTVGINIE